MQTVKWETAELDYFYNHGQKSWDKFTSVALFHTRQTNSHARIEGLRAKRAYIAFLADFHFLQDRANFWQTDLF